MLISHTHRFIFIHIPRTGGTSLTNLLCSDWSDVKRIGAQHASAHHNHTEIQAWPSYRTFTFVRNPWARLYSWFQLLQKLNPQHSFTLEQFLREQDPSRSQASQDNGFYFNQLDYLRDPQGNLVTDFIGRYENYQQDVGRLLELLDIPAAMPIPHLNTTEGPDYRSQYTHAARELVAERCSEDIAHFGYTFDS